MKTILVKERKKRVLYFTFYLKALLLKSIHANSYLPLQLRWEAFNELALFPVRSRGTQLKTRCLLTNRGKGVLKAFKISRIQLRSHLAHGFFTGVRRASW